MVVLFSLLAACTDAPEHADEDDTGDDDGTWYTPAASYDLPRDVTGFVGEVTWYAASAAADCEGRTAVIGTRDDTVCPSCDFAFTYTATELERTGDPDCTPLELLLWLTEDADLHHHRSYEVLGDYTTEMPGEWLIVSEYYYSYYYDGVEYTFPAYADVGVDGRTAIASERGVRLAGSGNTTIATPTSDWWSYCDEAVATDTAGTDLGTVEAEGLVPNGSDNEGDLWVFPVTEGDAVAISADHPGWAEADLLLWLAGPDGCLAVTAADSFACQSAPTDMCPSLVWTADTTGDVHIGVAAAGRAGDTVDYTLALHVNGTPVYPVAVEDDVTLAAIDYSLSTETAMTAILTWTY